MKFRVTFKDPDTLHDAIRDAVVSEVAKLELDDDEREAVIDKRCEKVGDAVSKWFKWSEYVTIECDTDAGTATVIPHGG
jgi:hypothetical protein